MFVSSLFVVFFYGCSCWIMEVFLINFDNHCSFMYIDSEYIISMLGHFLILFRSFLSLDLGQFGPIDRTAADATWKWYPWIIKSSCYGCSLRNILSRRISLRSFTLHCCLNFVTNGKTKFGWQCSLYKVEHGKRFQILYHDSQRKWHKERFPNQKR